MYDEIREAFEIQKAEAPARPVIQRKTTENGEEDPSDFSDVADADVDAFVLSAEETRKKAEMWVPSSWWLVRCGFDTAK